MYVYCTSITDITSLDTLRTTSTRKSTQTTGKRQLTVHNFVLHERNLTNQNQFGAFLLPFDRVVRTGTGLSTRFEESSACDTTTGKGGYDNMVGCSGTRGAMYSL